MDTNEIVNAVREAVGRRDGARDALAERIYDLCNGLPIGAAIGDLRVCTVEVRCAQYAEPCWGVRMGTARAVLWGERVIFREDASFFDNRNTQKQLTRLSACGHDEATRQDVRDCAAALPRLIAEYVAAAEADADQSDAALVAL